jgi:hypothetical protein
MVTFSDLCRVVKMYETDSIERVRVLYWIMSHHYGDSGLRYSTLCRLARAYSPGMMEEEYVMNTDAYRALATLIDGEKRIRCSVSPLYRLGG